MRSPTRLWQVLGLAGVIVLAIIVCLAVPGPGKRPENVFKQPEEPPPPSPDEKREMPSLPFALENGKAEFGNPEAKVKVVAFIPGTGGCGNETAIFVEQVADANKDRLRVEIVDFESEAGSKYESELGASCAGLVINGKQMIETTDDEGKKRTLDFTSNLGESYGEDELFLALDRAFEQAYGEKCKRVVPKPTQPVESDKQQADDTTADGAPTEQG